MKRSLLCLLLAACLLLCVSAQAEDNLLPNGGFEALTSSGEPVGWYPSAYRSQPGYSQLMVTSFQAHSGENSVLIENFSENDARYTTTVAVKPSSLYRLSCYVMVDGMEDVGNGANLAIEGIYAFSECVYDTGGEWYRMDWYGETGPKQKELTFGVRVGGYSAESVGRAYFDDVELAQVDALPDGVIADLWYDSRPSVPQAQSQAESGGKHTALFVAVAILFALAVWTTRFLSRKSDNTGRTVFVLCFVCALILRVALALCTEGYPVDIGCFTAWSLRMAGNGPWGFYAPDYFCDYPPGAMLLLWPVGWLLSAVGANESAAQLVVKLLPIVCDLAGAACLHRFARKRAGESVAAYAACLYLLAPAALVNGAVWGQVDSALALCMLLVCICAMEKRWRMAIPLFAVSVLIKPQALLFAPVGGMYLVFALMAQPKEQRRVSLRDVGFGALYAAAAALAIALPFMPGQSPDWLFQLYADTLSSYAYATLNTANLYYLAGANWMPLSAEAPRLMMALCALAFALAGGALCVPSLRDRVCRERGKAKALCVCFFAGWAFQVLALLLHASYAAYGYGMMAFAYALALVCLFFERGEGFLPFALALALIGVYMLGVKVHERYLFPALLLLLLSYVHVRDGRLLTLFAGLCGTTFVNTAIVWENAVLFGAEKGHLNLDTLGLNRVLCVVNLLLYGYAVYVAVTGLRERGSTTPRPAQEEEDFSLPESYCRMLLKPSDHRMRWKRFDTAVVCAVTAVYAVLAFTNLGSSAAPQTAWVSTSSDEAVVLALPESQSFHLLYYAGVSYHDFSVSVSEDGENWSEPYPCQMREGLCYRWLYAVNADSSNGEVSYASQNPSEVVSFRGRYVRINAECVGLNLWEVVARGEDGENLPLTLVSHTGGREENYASAAPASNLIDEADTCVGEPGWYNGTYFDEIYHARTAYEHLHGQTPYETTHPPLGKLLIACGIALFGMTPFGWRFAGALIGVAMLPALYALALQLTRRRDAAVVSMTALALDLMHFTQTRIATIDSFPVFFILLSYLFMVRYGQMDFFSGERRMDKGFVKTLVPLFFSGLCMGLSIASKWIGLYSAVGLAVLFFTFCVRRYLAAAVAFDLDEASLSSAESARVRTARAHTLQRLLITCLFCVLFFVVIPLAIYCASYIPYLSPNGPVTLRRIYLAQKGMLDYHSTPGLGMDHPFQSPWWQWPFLLKPMWFAQDCFEPAGYASTIMCMGNPWVFYLGAAAMICVLALWVCKYLRVREGSIVLRGGDGDLTLMIVSIAFLAQYLPWVLVPRSMYIYHYFASVPFIILSTAWCLSRVPESKRSLRRWLMAAYLLGALVFFVMYFPYASGRLTSLSWMNAVKGMFRLYY